MGRREEQSREGNVTRETNSGANAFDAELSRCFIAECVTCDGICKDLESHLSGSNIATRCLLYITIFTPPDNGLSNPGGPLSGHTGIESPPDGAIRRTCEMSLSFEDRPSSTVTLLAKPCPKISGDARGCFRAKGICL